MRAANADGASPAHAAAQHLFLSLPSVPSQASGAFPPRLSPTGLVFLLRFLSEEAKQSEAATLVQTEFAMLAADTVGPGERKWV